MGVAVAIVAVPSFALMVVVVVAIVMASLEEVAEGFVATISVEWPLVRIVIVEGSTLVAAVERLAAEIATTIAAV